jgi:hypothetical protein
VDERREGGERGERREVTTWVAGGLVFRLSPFVYLLSLI